jgi:hypothetical protein
MSSLERLAGAGPAPAETPTAGLRGRRHGEDRLHLLMRDPRRVFATWEVSPALAARAAARAVEAGAPLRYQLRIERAAAAEGPPSDSLTQDLADALGGESWYVDLPRGGGYARALLGLDLRGAFEPLLASRWIAIPPEGPCREEGSWPLDADATAWLTREAERLRSRVGARIPSSASRYLASPQSPKA